MRIIRFVFSKKQVARLYDPAYSDFLEEYTEALNASEKAHARWIQLRFYLALGRTLTLSWWVKAVSHFVSEIMAAVKTTR